MSKIVKSISFLSLFALSGCFTTEVKRLPSTGEEHVLVSNYGWNLFTCIPLLCGNALPEEERLLPWAFFRNDVPLEKVQSALSQYAKKQGKEITNLVYRNDNKILLNIPGEIPIPIPYILCYREVQLSGVLK